jgi:predicted SAM-dependent methyltransferase
MDGWFCIDAARHPQAPRDPDLISDVKKIALPDECAQEMMAIHLFEHLYRWECDEVIIEWRRILRPGGLLVLEMPDLMKFCRNVLSGAEGRHPGQLGMWGMYGDPRTKDPLMVHHWGWTYKTMRSFLKEHGFDRIAEDITQWHPMGRATRDFRVTARKA